MNPASKYTTGMNAPMHCANRAPATRIGRIYAIAAVGECDHGILQ